MTDVFDRAATLNFTTVATVRGTFTQAQLHTALLGLMRRHPLLTARVQREQEPWSLIVGEGERIPLRVQDGGLDAIKPALEATLNHREWPDAGPRGELTWLRHAPDHSTLLLCLHHTVSDGSSGILAMRDLLAFLQQPAEATISTLDAPAQDTFFPPLFNELQARFMASLTQKPATNGPTPYRLRTDGDIPLAERSTHTLAIRLTAEQSARVAAFARSVGATVHGVLCASLLLAHAQEAGENHLQRVAHPVSLRRYLQEKFPEQPTIGDAVGYYVSSVQTDHQMNTQRSLGELAREVSLSVRTRKDEHEPLVSAPMRGPMVAERAKKMELDSFRAWTFALSNLGELEKLGAQHQVAALSVEDFYFGLACSIMGAFGGAAVSFRGQITLHLTYIHPLIAHDAAERVRSRAFAHLVQLA
jgi:NRPS condensation-like uncharacterized protein